MYIFQSLSFTELTNVSTFTTNLYRTKQSSEIKSHKSLLNLEGRDF
jgi:hypothetical protein